MNQKPVYNLLGKFGPLYDMFLSVTGYKKSVSFFIDELKKETGELTSFLDAGCGTGPYSLAILEKFPNAKVVAFDFEETMVAQAKKNFQEAGFANRIEVFTEDINGPMQKVHGPFNAIVASGILEYTPLEPTVKKLSQFLEPGGYVMHIPVRDTLYGKLIEIPYRFKAIPQKKALSAFTDNGFKLIRIVNVSPLSLPSFKEAHIFKKM